MELLLDCIWKRKRKEAQTEPPEKGKGFQDQVLVCALAADLQLHVTQLSPNQV